LISKSYPFGIAPKTQKEIHMLKKFFLFLILILIISGCEPAQQETDQGYYVERKYNSNLYYLTLELENEPSNYSQLNGSISGFTVNGFGSMSGSIWEDGKGLVRGEIKELTPETDFASVSDTIIIKTTDFKVMGLKPGDTAYFVCTVDFEPVCAAKGEYSNVPVCYDIWEFDYCRMRDLEPID